MCHCLRNGKWGSLPVKELVPGDIIGLKGGDVIPADRPLSHASVARATLAFNQYFSPSGLLEPQKWVLVKELQPLRRSCLFSDQLYVFLGAVQLIGEGEPLKIDESSLTGECLAVTRHPGQEAPVLDNTGHDIGLGYMSDLANCNSDISVWLFRAASCPACMLQQLLHSTHDYHEPARHTCSGLI
eukprot:1138531-Pelagomonas_calceolata.AAC.4